MCSDRLTHPATGYLGKEVKHEGIFWTNVKMCELLIYVFRGNVFRGKCIWERITMLKKFKKNSIEVEKS